MNSREKYYRDEFNALRDSIKGDPTPSQIAELSLLIKEENMERDNLRMESQVHSPKDTVKLLLNFLGKSVEPD